MRLVESYLKRLNVKDEGVKDTSKVILPAGAPPMEMSKNTFGLLGLEAWSGVRVAASLTSSARVLDILPDSFDDDDGRTAN